MKSNGSKTHINLLFIFSKRIMMKRKFILFFALLFFCLLMLEETSRYFLLPQKIPNSEEVRRNHFYRRGWLEYTSFKRSNDHRIILISNSQGYARELPENLIYPTLLENKLNKSKFQGLNDWRVENWSLPGGNFPEFIILAAKAATIKARIVIVSFYILNLKPSFFNQDISFFLNDTNRLLLDSKIRSKIPENFLKRHFPKKVHFKTFFQNYSATLKAKEYLFNKEIFSIKKPSPLLRDIVFFINGPQGFKETWFYNHSLRRKQANQKTDFVHLKHAGLFYRRKSLRFLEEYVTTLKDSGKQIMLVSMPLCSKLLLSRRPQEKFSKDATFICRQLDVSFLDASFLLPDDEFILFTHLNIENNKRYAELLFKYITS